MYMGEPHMVAAMAFVWRWRANPKSAGGGHKMDNKQWVEVQVEMSSSCIYECVLCSVHWGETVTYFNAGINGTCPAPLWVAQQNVLGFQVSVEDPFGSEDLHGLSNLLQEYADGVLAQCALSCETTWSQR